MARLIDADALMKYIRNHDYQLVSRMGCVDKGMFTDGIEHGINIQPTVDVVEVVHGRTEVIEPFEVTLTVRCCLCGAAMGNLDNYRPNCGAKMDGDGNAKRYF